VRVHQRVRMIPGMAVGVTDLVWKSGELLVQ
jgi:hypothetical protein